MMHRRDLLNAAIAAGGTSLLDGTQTQARSRDDQKIIDTNVSLFQYRWHQERHFGRSSNIDFNNPDFVKYAESFGAKGYRVESANELAPILRQAIADDTVVIIDCPVDYSENMKLTEKLGNLVCPI